MFATVIVLITFRYARTQEIRAIDSVPAPMPTYGPSQPEVLGPAQEGLTTIARKSLQAVVLVGHPEHGLGTAFVVSKKNRLLVTNAHVADIMATAGTMLAWVNGAAAPCAVDRVWYHPGIVRKHDNCLAIRCQDPLHGPVAPPCPDVAVLHLADGLELPAELALATPGELNDLFAQRVGAIGYPKYDNARWPLAGDIPQPTFRSGFVNRLLSFSGDENCPSNERQMVQHDMGTWFGSSGSPIFLSNGHVVAIDTYLAVVASKNNATTNLDFGVRVDCLWELLFYHHLADQVTFAADRTSLSMRRYETPDPKETDLHSAIQLVHRCDRLLLDGQYVLAAEYCNQAIQLAPAYAKAYQMRSEVLNEFVEFNKNTLDRNVQRQQLQWALDDAKRCLTMSSDPSALLDMNMRRICLQQVTKDSPYDQDVTSAMTKLLDVDVLTPQQRAYAYRIRAVSTGYQDAALADLDEATRLAPYGKAGCRSYNMRAVFWRMHNDPTRAAADREKAQELLGAEKKAVEATDLLAKRNHSQDDVTRALRLVHQACKVTDYRYWRYLDLLAMAYYDMGDNDMARTWGARTLALAPETDSPRIRGNLNAYRSLDLGRAPFPGQSYTTMRQPTLADGPADSLAGIGSDMTRDDAQWRETTSADSEESVRTSDIQKGDVVVTLENTKLKMGQRSLAEVPKGTQFLAKEIVGDWVGVFGVVGGREQAGWVEKRALANVNHMPTNAGQTPPSVYGSSIITFDNRSGDPALVRLVGPTQGEVFVPNGSQGSIHHVAAGSYVIYVRYGNHGGYRYSQGERFDVTGSGRTFSNVSITLHTVESGNYAYRDVSEDEFNQAAR
jgi:tetratricopeptide (TPR) repeat protein